MSRKVILLLLFLLLLTGLIMCIILLRNNHGDTPPTPTPTPIKYYRCDGDNCIEDTTGAKQFPNDNKCNSSCGGGSIRTNNIKLPQPITSKRPNNGIGSLNATYWNYADNTFSTQLVPPKTIEDCLRNYFTMLYPATSRQYWTQCTSEQLYSIYNMLDWYYTPFIIDPQLPYMAVNKDTKSLSGIKGLNTLDGIKNSKGGPQQRLRPLVGPYAEAYVQFFPMAGFESVLDLQCPGSDPVLPKDDSTCSTTWEINPPVGGNYIGVAVTSNPGWLSDPSSNDPPSLTENSYQTLAQWISPPGETRNLVGRPLMATYFIQPYGIARQGFPSYAYVEVVDFTSEAGGMRQEANIDGSCRYPWPDTPKMRSFCGACNNTPQDFENSWKYGVGKPAEGIMGSAYVGNDNGNVTGWGGPIKEEFTQTNDDKCSGVQLDSKLNCLCYAKSSGVTDNPNVNSTDLLPGTKQQLGQRCLSDAPNCQLLYSLTADHKPYRIETQPDLSLYTKSKDQTTFTPVDPKDVVYCSPASTYTDWKYGCSGNWYRDLFYPIKGYGKFSNLGKSGTYFNYVHALIAVSDRDKPNFGVQFRRPLSEICAEHYGQGCCTPSAGWKCIGRQVSDLAGFGFAQDNRQYLSGWVTIPRKDKFPGTGLAAYEDAILKGGGGSLEWAAPNGGDSGVWKFIPGKPQVTWEGGKLGCGQTRWMKGEWDPFTKSTLQTANEWMNPMDDGEVGNLYYLGVNFRQYYCPPEMMIKNPNYQKTIGDLYPNWSPTQIESLCGSKNGTGAWDDAQKDSRQQFALAWMAGFQCYGDTGIHEGTNWPFGLLGVTGTPDDCLYNIIQAMGWKSMVISMKDDICGQGAACEYPYCDSEILFVQRRNCEAKWDETMTRGCGPLGPAKPPQNDEYAPYMQPPAWSGPTITCQTQVTLDISVNMNRYLQDNFLPAFVDRSTLSDVTFGNKNQTIYNAQATNRQKFALSGASTDIPAQSARKLYNPPTDITYCSICPGNITQNMPYKKGKGWVETTNEWVGKPHMNSFNSEEQQANDFMYKQWSSTKLHKKMGCYSIQN